jgi:hypothetical protein
MISIQSGRRSVRPWYTLAERNLTDGVSANPERLPAERQ